MLKNERCEDQGADSKSQIMERIIAARKSTGLNQTEFGRGIGFTQSGLSSLELSGNLQIQTALAIEAAHGINHEWLMRGVGGMMKENALNSEEWRLINRFRESNRQIKSAILMLLDDAKRGGDRWDGVTERRSKDHRGDSAIFMVERRGH